MAKFLKRLLLFGVILTAAYLLILALLAHAGPGVQGWARERARIPVRVAKPRGDTTLRFREVGTYHDVDVLFAGSSHCYRAFDPRLFQAHGWSSFNLGSISQGPVNSYFLLRRYLDTLRPRLLVLEVYWGALQIDGVESLLDLCGSTPPAFDLFLMAIATGSGSGVTGYLLDRFDPQARPAGTAAPELGPGDRYVPGGFVEKDSSFVVEQVYPPAGPVQIRPQQLTFLRRILHLARQRGIRTVLVVQPVPPEHLRRITNREAYLSQIRSLAEREGSQLLDFNTMMRMDDRWDFFDGDHLSQRGVEAFDARLLEELEVRGLLPRGRVMGAH